MTQQTRPLRIAMIGTRGAPARYGGFETAVEEVGARLAQEGHEVFVYSRNRRQRLSAYKGMRIINLPALRRPVLETLSHSFLSMLHALLKIHPDCILLFNAANAPLLWLARLRRIPVAVHIDGLEWKRAKWRGVGARYFLWAEAHAVNNADEIISDARGIVDYVHLTYGRASRYIPYGTHPIEACAEAVEGTGLQSGQYHLVVSRVEPENHVLEIVNGFHASHSRWPLVVVGAAAYGTPYTRLVRAAIDATPNVRSLGAVWDQTLLDQLYANCASYLHGHSVGGTNPSLLRALGAGAPTIAFDVVFNREVTNGEASFFRSEGELAEALRAVEQDPAAHRLRAEAARERAIRIYSWDAVAAEYASLAADLADAHGNYGSKRRLSAIRR